MINVGLIGIGGMGRMHFNCYQNSTAAQLVAISDIDTRKLQGDWSSISLNLDSTKSEFVDLSGIATYENAHDLINDPNVQMVDICLPTPQHAPLTIAALRAGKDVFCEKPMALDAAQCEQMRQAAQESGRQLMIGHCLRYWPQYVRAHEIMQSGEYGKVLYAHLHRFSPTPLSSWNNWMCDGSQSGGAVLDMHIHDVDTALWWFGEPTGITANGLLRDDFPASVDATWHYDSGPLVYLHGSWDLNGGNFRMAFRVVMEGATLEYDTAGSQPDALQLHIGQQTQIIEVGATLAYQAELDDFAACLVQGKKMERVTPQSSQKAVEVVHEELRQIRNNAQR
jgi:predicted dehydrogenase